MDRETHVKHLIQLAKADGQVHPHELIFIQSLALRMGIDGSVFQRIASHPDLVPFRMASREEDRFTQLCELVMLLHIDQQTEPEELAYVEKVGMKLGFSAEKVDKLVDYFGSNPMPQDLEAFRKSL